MPFSFGLSNFSPPLWTAHRFNAKLIAKDILISFKARRLCF